MKLLKIEENDGLFLDEEEDFTPIDEITKEDLIRLVNLTLAKEVEFDEFNAEALNNQAHQIIYKSIVEKLVGLRDRRQEFTDESERLYLEDYERYQEELSEKDSEPD